MNVRYHGQHQDGHRRTLTRKTVLVDLADLPAWLADKGWAGAPIYLMAEPVAGLLSGWRKSCAEK